MRLVVDNPNPEPETDRGSPVAVAVLTVAVLGALGSCALLAARTLGAPMPDWVVCAPLAVGIRMSLAILFLAICDRRDAA